MHVEVRFHVRLAGAGLWTVEAAHQIMYCVDVQIRRSRQEAIALDRQVQALNRRYDEARKSSQRALEQYTQSCAQVGVAGDDIEHELGCAIAKIPLELQTMLSCLQQQTVRIAVESYSSFASETEGCNLETLHEFLSTPSNAPLASFQMSYMLYVGKMGQGPAKLQRVTMNVALNLIFLMWRKFSRIHLTSPI